MDKKGQPFFSVIIPTCRRNEELALCLERLAPWSQIGGCVVGQEYGENTSSPFTYEVIVSDDDPRGGAREWIQSRFPWARWIQGPHRGPAANRNCGSSLASGEWLIFTDDDCLPSTVWLSSYHTSLQKNAGKISVLEGQTSAIGERDHIFSSAPINKEGGCLWSCNLAIRKEAFLELKGFDEDFPFAAMEDTDFHLRIQKVGLEVLFVPNALVEHPWKIPTDLRLHWKRHFKSQMIFLSKHPEQQHLFKLRVHLKGILRFWLLGFWKRLLTVGPTALKELPLVLWSQVYFTVMLAWKPRPKLPTP